MSGEELSPNQYRELRIQKIGELGQAAYPHKFNLTQTIPGLRNLCEVLANGVTDVQKVESIAGRIISKRNSSNKLFFYEIMTDVHTIQVLANFAFFEGSLEAFIEINMNTLRRGDIIGVTGHPARSKSGELSIVPVGQKGITLLSPCVRMLPKPGTLTDTETRHRHRYLDGIVNRQSVMEVFKKRAQIISYIRNFFDGRGFIHVETPTMSLLPGGATAKPFVTYHNDLDMNMFMRVSPELDLKKCIIAGFDKVYEIGRNYRNESADLTHNPEFTAIEVYEAYADYEDMIKMTEELLSSMVMTLFGKYQITYTTSSGKETIIDFAPPFKRYPLIETLEEKMGVKFLTDFESPESEAQIKKMLEEKGVKCSPPLTVARMIDALVGEYIEPLLHNPSFITEHLQLSCPLAKYHRSKPGVTERFELFVLGKELCNSYTELNNPFVQKDLFEKQQKDRDAGDDESMPIDLGFIEAMEHGLPPTGGWGMGIDRLVMFLTNQSSIREVILFPANRPTDLERQAQKQMKRVVEKSLRRAGEQ